MRNGSNPLPPLGSKPPPPPNPPLDEIRFVGEMARLELKSGDVLVLTYEEILSDAHCKDLRDKFKIQFPSVDCIVLSGGLRLGVINAEALK